MKLEQIDKAIKAIKAVGIDLDNFDPVEIEVHLGVPTLNWLHKSDNIEIYIKDPTNYPTNFEVLHLD